MIHKSHSKTDLVNLINTINIPLIHSHSHNKKDIQRLLSDFFLSSGTHTFTDNVYDITDKRELELYLIRDNPKKNLSVKEKNTIMNISRNIIHFCNQNYEFNMSVYDNEKDLEDDILYIIQYGDLPSVRRACKFINKRPTSNTYNPLISPQVQKELDEKHILRNYPENNKLVVRSGQFSVSFL